MAQRPKAEPRKVGSLPGPVSVSVTRSHATSSPSLPDPSELWSGRLRPGEEVGRGATASVIRGVDTKLRRELAIKVTTEPRENLPTELLARFVQEAQVTAQLEHPNVVPVHDMGIDPQGRAYFSMKLVRGHSLESILERRKDKDAATLSEFGLRRLLEVFLQVCQAVDYAHARGVIHRDLKPANIMVGDFGEVLVMDWGIANVKGRSESMPEITTVRAGNDALATHMGAVLGTPAYMAPEQALGQDVDERADVYSLGVILYEIVCGALPFEGDDASALLGRVIAEIPRPPSRIAPDAPPALEALVMRMLEKKPERRALTIRQIRSHVQDYIEGVGHEYRRESFFARVAWLVGALAGFAFLVWYLTGESVATFVALTPAVVFNAIGWLLLTVAVSYPLWAAWVGFRASRTEHDRFRPPTREELFVSGFFAHRTRAAAIAPLFQLVFLVDLVVVAVQRAKQGARSAELVQSAVEQLRADWSHTLIVVLLFLFAYVLLLSTEVRFARRIDRYIFLARRARWESLWPTFLIVVLLSTVVLSNVAEWMMPGAGHGWTFVRDRLLVPRLDVFDIVKTLVFQGTFLLGLVVVSLLLAFPFSEVLASLRMAYQPGDDASVSSRQQYFLRSMAVFEVAGANWLYGGAMIACVTAVTILSRGQQPLVEQVVYILGPSLIGFAGYAFTRRYSAGHLENAPAVKRMRSEQAEAARAEQARANLEQLAAAPWRWRLVQVAVPIACVLAYLVWTGSGVGTKAIQRLVMPVSTHGWLLILPYALLAPLLLVRDSVQRWLLRRRSRA